MGLVGCLPTSVFDLNFCFFLKKIPEELGPNTSNGAERYRRSSSLLEGILQYTADSIREKTPSDGGEEDADEEEIEEDDNEADSFKEVHFARRRRRSDTEGSVEEIDRRRLSSDKGGSELTSSELQTIVASV